jgi:hypothetical protein
VVFLHPGGEGKLRFKNQKRLSVYAAFVLFLRPVNGGFQDERVNGALEAIGLLVNRWGMTRLAALHVITAD